MRMHNLHSSKIRFNTGWRWVGDKWCEGYLENATVTPSRAFDTSGFSRVKCTVASWSPIVYRTSWVASCKRLAHVDLRRNATTLAK